MTNEELCFAIRKGEALPVEMWLRLQPYIKKLARPYAADDAETLQDLLQESYFGIVTAINLYNPDEGAGFATYAGYWIKQVMRRYIDNSGRVVRVPVHAVDRANKYKRMVGTFRRDFGRDPTGEELKAAFGCDRDQLERDLLALSTTSLDAPLTDDGLTVAETVAAPDDVESTVLDKINQEELRKTLWNAVDSLPENERKTIRMRYQNNLTLKDCGAVMGVTLERVRAIEAQAMRKLRKQKITKQLEPYIDDLRYRYAVKGGRMSFFINGSSSTETAALKAMDYLQMLQKDGLI